MNKTALGAILGAALLGLAKSKGSSARKMPLDDFFKRRTGNENQTYRVFFKATYQPFWKDSGYNYNCRSDFTEKIGFYKESIIGMMYDFDYYVANEWILGQNGRYYSADEAGMLEQQIGDAELDDYSLHDIFEKYCDDNLLATVYGNESPYDYGHVDSWIDEAKDLELIGNIQITRGSNDFLDLDIIEQTINLQKEDAEVDIEKVFETDFQDENNWAFVFEKSLRKRGNYFFRNTGISWDPNNYTEFDQLKPRLLEHTDILKDYLDNISSHLFSGSTDFIDWDHYVEPDSGFIEGYVDVRLDLHSMAWDKDFVKQTLQTMLENDYKEWLRDNGQDDENESFELTITKVEPDIFAKKKSNLRIR